MVNEIGRQLSVVTGAPLLTVVMVLAVVGIVWGIFHFLYRHRNDGLNESLRREQAETIRLRGRVTELEKGGGSQDGMREKIAGLEASLSAIQPRRLSGDQKAALQRTLGLSPGVFHGILVAGTEDGHAYLGDFGEALHDAGWKGGGGTAMGPMPKGVGLSVTLRRGSPAAKAFGVALQNLGVPHELEELDEIANADVLMMVSRPN